MNVTINDEGHGSGIERGRSTFRRFVGRSEIPAGWRQRSNALLLPDQDHRAIKRVIKPMMGLKDFRCARIILSGVEVMQVIRKGPTQTAKETAQSAAEQFDSLVI